MKSRMSWLYPENSVTAGITDQGTEKLFGILLAVTEQLIMNPKSKKRPIPPCIQPPPARAKLCQPGLPRELCTSPWAAPTWGPPSPHKRVRGRAKPAAHTCGSGGTPPPPFTNAESGGMEAFEHTLSPILLTRLPPSCLRVYSSIHPHGQRSTHTPCTLGTSAQTSPAPCCPTTPLPQANAPSSIRHTETMFTHTRTTSCPGLQHSASRVSNSQDTA